MKIKKYASNYKGFCLKERITRKKYINNVTKYVIALL